MEGTMCRDMLFDVCNCRNKPTELNRLPVGGLDELTNIFSSLIIHLCVYFFGRYKMLTNEEKLTKYLKKEMYSFFL